MQYTHIMYSYSLVICRTLVVRCIIKFSFLLDIQKTVSTRQKLDAQLNENKIVLEVLYYHYFVHLTRELVITDLLMLLHEYIDACSVCIFDLHGTLCIFLFLSPFIANSPQTLPYPGTDCPVLF